jgi:hypothetical protein
MAAAIDGITDCVHFFVGASGMASMAVVLQSDTNEAHACSD